MDTGYLHPGVKDGHPTNTYSLLKMMFLFPKVGDVDCLKGN